MKRVPSLLFLVLLLPILNACVQEKKMEVCTSVDGDLWNTKKLGSTEYSGDNYFRIERNYAQQIDGFGAVFNELGWDALHMIPYKERQKILREFYSESGFNFTICRMPIGANDYARDWYSLNETPGDFAMEEFNVDRDLTSLIPYISEALKIRPDMKIWGSPWCPPIWMKINNHYACRSDIVNDLEKDKAGKEDQTQFIMQEEYLNAYALYFIRYIEAYKQQGIEVSAIHVQNEPNSCQNFPSCIWTATDLSTFIGKYLGPALDAHGIDAEIWLGTIERPSLEKVDTVLSDPESKKYVSGVGFQWAGKECIPKVHRKYPEMKLMQTESECGDGSNDWPAAEYTWSLIKHYIENGASVYTYWNTVLDETGKSMWGWKQNSLISIDSRSGKIHRNPEFYLMKHLSHFVKPGANKLVSPEGFDCGLLFENPDGKIIGLLVNDTDFPNSIVCELDGQFFKIDLKAHSFNSVIF